MNDKKMSELEETLSLMGGIEDPKIKLDRKVDGLLEANGYDVLKENKKKFITIYGKKESIEVFIKYGSNDYCFAMLKEEKPIVDNIEDFYKRFRRTTEQPITPVCTGLGGFAIGCSIGIYHLLNDFLLCCGSIFAPMITGAYLTVYLETRLKNRNKKRLEESCKEIDYGKEALEKAFKR